MRPETAVIYFIGLVIFLTFAYFVTTGYADCRARHGVYVRGIIG